VFGFVEIAVGAEIGVDAASGIAAVSHSAYLPLESVRAHPKLVANTDLYAVAVVLAVVRANTVESFEVRVPFQVHAYGSFFVGVTKGNPRGPDVGREVSGPRGPEGGRAPQIRRKASVQLITLRALSTMVSSAGSVTQSFISSRIDALVCSSSLSKSMAMGITSAQV
jgi:hypothetical protein